MSNNGRFIINWTLHLHASTPYGFTHWLYWCWLRPWSKTGAHGCQNAPAVLPPHCYRQKIFWALIQHYSLDNIDPVVEMGVKQYHFGNWISYTRKKASLYWVIFQVNFPLPTDPLVVITVTSLWARLRLKSPAPRLFNQPFVQTQINENIKALHHWPLWGNSPVTGEFPAQKATYAENVSIWWRHHGVSTCRRHDLLAIWYIYGQLRSPHSIALSQCPIVPQVEAAMVHVFLRYVMAHIHFDAMAAI